MNIAMLSVHTCPLAALGGKETGGMNVYVRELTRELARRGHRIDIFTRSQNPEIPHIEMDGLGHGADVFHIPAGPEAPYDKRRLFNYLPEFVQGVHAFAESEHIQYDVYHAHYWLSGWVAHELVKYQSAPIVQMFHTLCEMKNAAARTEADREIERRVQVEREIMQYVDRIVAATPRDRQQMIDLYGAAESKIEIIPPGVDLNLFRPVEALEARDFIEMPYDHQSILFVGRIDPIKGLDVWFKAIELIVEQDPALREKLCVCLVGGDLDEEIPSESELGRLKTLKDELGIGDVVTFLGRRSQECLPYYYSAADIVVMPSRYESFGMAALEAMACGTPVVASDVGGLSFVVRDGETGYLVPEGNPYALADCVGYLLHHPEVRSHLGKRGIEVAREYAWPRIADEIEALYQRTIQEKKLATA
jgi:D-inositol-3-phosphate glycosyltransferase